MQEECASQSRSCTSIFIAFSAIGLVAAQMDSAVRTSPRLSFTLSSRSTSFFKRMIGDKTMGDSSSISSAM